jgi:hypothetical protein
MTCDLASHFPSQGLSFLICEMGLVIVSDIGRLEGDDGWRALGRCLILAESG